MIADLDWQKIYAEGYPDPRESGYPEEEPEFVYHPPSGSGAQKAAGWNAPDRLPSGFAAMLADYASAYPDEARKEWIVGRLIAWREGRR